MIVSTTDQFVQPEIQYIGAGKRREYLLLDDYCFQWVKDGVPMRRIVRKGYNTDLASVPWLFGFSDALGFSPYGAHEGAAVLHDRGYQVKGKLPVGEYQVQLAGEWHDSDSRWKRIDCDRLFRAMCLLGGMDPIHANIEYEALRIGGGWTDGIGWHFS